MRRLRLADEQAAKRLGVVAVWVAMFAWAWGYVLVKWSTLDGLHFAMFRLWAGTAVSCVALLVTGRRLTWAVFRTCVLGGVFFAADIGLGFTAIKHTTIADVATPFEGKETCDCHDLTGDGIPDLVLHFKSQPLVEALQLNDLPPGSFVELCVCFSVGKGGQCCGRDCIRLVPPTTGAPAVGSNL